LRLGHEMLHCFVGDFHNAASGGSLNRRAGASRAPPGDPQPR
jgi:hypothetical protein